MITKIKTMAFLLKCLKVDIPIYKDVETYAIRVHRVMIYKTCLIELMSCISNDTFYILLSREHADAIIGAMGEVEKERKEAAAAHALTVAQQTASLRAEVAKMLLEKSQKATNVSDSEGSLQEPGYELLDNKDEPDKA